MDPGTDGARSFLQSGSWRGCACVIASVLAAGAMLRGAFAGEPLAVPAVAVELTARLTATAALPGGGYVVGGTFERVNGIARNHVARFHADGSLDPGWEVDFPFGTVIEDIAVDSSGNIYVSGNFHAAAGLPRNGLVKVLPSGQVDPGWAPVVAGGTVVTMAVGDDGWLYLGGNFSAINGDARSRLARIPLGGSGAPTDPAWTPSASALVQTLVIDGGDVLVGGEFTTLSGLGRTRLARLSRAPGAAVSTTWVPSANARVSALLVGDDGDVVIGGRFSALNGQPVAHLGKVRGVDAGLVASWMPNPTGEVLALAPGGAGWLLAGGSFGFVGPMHQAAAARIRHDGGGEIDGGWRPRLQPGIVTDLAQLADGSVVLGGSLQEINEQPARYGAARLTGDTGALLSPIDLDQRGTVRGMTKAADGSVILVGSFDRVDRQRRRTIAKIRADGQLDAAWDLGFSNFEYANVALIDGEDRLYVGGWFTLGSGTPVNHLARTNLTGPPVVDTSWRPSPDAEVLALAMSTDGSRLYVGGAFASIGAAARARIARLDTSGTGLADADWGPAVNANVNVIHVGASGSIYLGGPFTSVDGQNRARLVRVPAANPGLLDAVWNPQPNERIHTVKERPEGVYVGGWYTAIGGVSRRNLARLPAPTGSADAWAPNPYGGVNALHFIDATRLLIGGSFLDVAGAPIAGLAVISLADPAVAEPLQWFGSNHYVLTLLANGGSIWLGGYFNQVGSTARYSLAAIAEPAADPVFASGFDP